MSLSAEHKKLVKEKIDDGATLGELQNTLQAVGVQMTYMELRFLLDDLGLSIREKPQKPAEAPATTKTETASEPIDDGAVSVTMDTVVRAGALVSGSVIFSDGTAAQWSLDQMGRLGLAGTPAGYKPSPGDVAEFQGKLRELIESRGGI